MKLETLVTARNVMAEYLVKNKPGAGDFLIKEAILQMQTVINESLAKGRDIITIPILPTINVLDSNLPTASEPSTHEVDKGSKRGSR